MTLPKTVRPAGAPARLALDRLDDRVAPSATPAPVAPVQQGDGLSALYVDSPSLDRARELIGPAVAATVDRVDFDTRVNGNPWRQFRGPAELNQSAQTSGVTFDGRFDTFAARFAGRVEAPTTGDYVFRVTGDDGVRLWVDDKLVVGNGWKNQGSTAYTSAPVPLTRGQKAHIVLEYYENGGDSAVKLEWDRPADGAGFGVVDKAFLYSDRRELPAEMFVPAAAIGDRPHFAAGYTEREVTAFGVVNVKDFGAKGDGLTDDWRAIQQAISAVAGNGDANSIVYFPAGTYRVSQTLAGRQFVVNDATGELVPTPGYGADGGWTGYVQLHGQQRDNVVLRLDDGKYTKAPSSTGVQDRAAFTAGGPYRSNAVVLTAGQNFGEFDREGRLSPGFFDGGNNLAFENTIRDLTVHTGKGNGGAVGIDYQVSNQGGITNVRVTSSDGLGYAGVRGIRRDNGPGLLADVAVDGFARGIELGGYGFTFEDIRLTNQAQVGFDVRTVAAVRRLQSTQAGDVPAVLTGDYPASVSLVDSTLTTTSGGKAAVLFGDRTGDNIGFQATHFFRNVATSGYAAAVGSNDTPVDEVGPGNFQFGPTVYRARVGPTALQNNGELAVPEVRRTFATDPTTSLRLGVQEVPVYDPPPGGWRYAGDPTSFDDTAMIQAALDAAAAAGQTAVYFKPGATYYVSGTIRVPGGIRKLAGGLAVITTFTAPVPGIGTAFADAAAPAPALLVADASAHPLVVDGLKFGVYFEGDVNTAPGTRAIQHDSARPLALVNQVGWSESGQGYRPGPAAGPLFLVDSFAIDFRIGPGQQAWFRQWNAEPRQGQPAALVNDGGRLWVLGLKTEIPRTIVDNRNGARTEIFGAAVYPLFTGTPDVPIFRNDAASDLSVSYRTVVGGSYPVDVRTTQRVNGLPVSYPFTGVRGNAGLYRGGPQPTPVNQPQPLPQPLAGNSGATAFEDFADGRADGFQATGAGWAVTGGEYRSAAGAGERTAVAGDPGWANYVVGGWLTPAATGRAAVLGRVQNANTYYALSVGRTAGGDFAWELRKRVNGSWTALQAGTVPAAGSAGGRLQVYLAFTGNRLFAQYSVNGRDYVNLFAGNGVVTDAVSPLLTGRVGLLADGGEQRFDDLDIQLL